MQESEEDREILANRMMAARAKEVIETLAKCNQDEKASELAKVWLEAYENVERLRNIEFPPCKLGWKRHSRACQECGQLRPGSFFRDVAYAYAFDGKLTFDRPEKIDAQISMAVHYAALVPVGRLRETMEYHWSANLSNDPSKSALVEGGISSCSMNGFEFSYEKACESAEKAALFLARYQSKAE